MRITYPDHRNVREVEISVSGAVEQSIRNADFDVAGTVECVDARLKAATEIIAVLAGVLARHGLLTADDLRYKLHYKFTVEE